VLLNGIAKYRERDHTWTFPNGSVLEFGYSEKERDIIRFQGTEYDDICWDELTQFSEFQYTYMFSRTRTVINRPGGIKVRPLIRAGSNPGNIGHGWVKTRFVDPAPYGATHYASIDIDGVEYKILRKYIPATLDDNPYLDKGDYLIKLSQLPPEEYRALRHGDWDVFAGQYFKLWRRDKHVITPFEIPTHWRRFRSLDYGFDCTACYWWAISEQGREYVYRELYEPDHHLSSAARRIVGLTPDEENILYTVASPDLWNRRQDTGISGVENMEAAGLRGLYKADDRRIPGWQAMYEHLVPKPDEIVGAEIPILQFFENCTHAIRTIPMLVRDEKNPNDVSDGCEDHAGESIRYGIMSRPPITQQLPDDSVIARNHRRRPQTSGGNRWTGY
jgi:hypothetical protein